MYNINDYYKKREDPYKPKLRRGRNGPLTFFLVIAAVIFIMSVFFKVSVIEVEGNGVYTDEEIISAAGIYDGDNLFFINGIAAGTRITAKLPYIDTVQIERSLPNKVTVIVTESRAVAYVKVGDELWSVSGDGKFLSEIDSEDAESLASITGITVSSAAEGERIAAAEGESGKLAYLVDILYQIQARGLTDSVAAIDLSDESDATFEYDGRFLCRLGAAGDTEYKFGKLLSAVSQLSEDDAGALDLSAGDKVVFNPN